MDLSVFSNIDIPEKEKLILISAIDIFSEKGFSASTTSEIAKKAGVAEGTIFRYFKTKKDILRGILVQAISLLGQKIVLNPIEEILINSEDNDLKTILKKVFYDRIKLFDNVFPMARVILTEAFFHEDIREAIYQNIISNALEMIESFQKRAAEKGLIRQDIDSQALLRSILGNLAIFFAQRKLFGDKFEMQDLDVEIDRIIDIILYGISPKQGGT